MVATVTTRRVAAAQPWLDALQLAAALVGPDRAIIAANADWRALGDVLDRAEAGTPQLARVLAGGVAESFEWRDGGLVDGRHYAVKIAPVTGLGALITLADRTAERRAERSLRGEMLTDSLTGLPNRAGFVELLETRMRDDGPDDYAVVAVDLARFARVNECIGAIGGDELLITVARRITTVLRAHDILARTGSNEFAIVVRVVDGPGDALHVARRIEGALGGPCRLSDFEIKVDCAIGCAYARDAAGDAELLMQHAQVALKAAKRLGRIEVYRPGASVAARRRFTLETELRRAIDDEALELAFQPLVSLSDGRVAGFEALARWTHPVLGAVPPDEFIAVAEDSGLIVALGRWALDSALATLGRWDAIAARTLPIHVGVNLSAIQVARDDIAGMVERALKRHRLAGYRLTVELTESAVIADPERAGRTLDALKACDALVAMDDFGTGFSNLATLQKLPIDTLKIDRSFVTDMIGDADKVAIVKAILGLAKALGMSTTAEGIETAELARVLAELGCATGQGYLYAPPLDADAALDFAMASLAP